MSTPANTLNVTSAGYVYFDGSNTFTTSGSSSKLIGWTFDQINTSVPCTGTINTTTPTSSDGTQILTTTYTPASTSNYLIFNVTVNAAAGTGSGQTNIPVFILCEGSTVIGMCGNSANNSDNQENMVFNFIRQAPSTSSLTYTVRCGPGTGATGGTMTVNQFASASGLCYSSIRIEEWAP